MLFSEQKTQICIFNKDLYSSFLVKLFAFFIQSIHQYIRWKNAKQLAFFILAERKQNYKSPLVENIPSNWKVSANW